jgi:light-regulated signal transduction histidine kinase (bacteriophytochrome)
MHARIISPYPRYRRKFYPCGAHNIGITLVEDTHKDTLSLEIKDDGSGMSEDVLKKVLDPFYTTKTVRNVGLGLPMLAQATERTEGHFIIESKGGEGTKVAAVFKLSHIDRQPLGDIASTLVTPGEKPAFISATRSARLHFSFFL